MKQLLSRLLLAIFMASSLISPLSLASDGISKTDASVAVSYPQGSDFDMLKSLIEQSFDKKADNYYGYQCIYDGILCPNYTYTSVTEKAIKLIIAKTFQGNEAFYRELFKGKNRRSYAIEKVDDNKDVNHDLLAVLNNVPNGTQMTSWKALDFGNTPVSSRLIDASFGVNFGESDTKSGLLKALDDKVKSLRQQKCKKYQEYTKKQIDCYTSKIDNANRYLPTQQELLDDEIFLNGQSVSIRSISDQFIYEVTGNQIQFQSQKPSREDVRAILESKGMTFTEDELDQVTLMYQGGANSKKSLDMMMFDADATYDLRYTKTNYTIDEAKESLKKNHSSADYVMSNDGPLGTLPCLNMTLHYAERTRCEDANRTIYMLLTALRSYSINNQGTFPENIDELKKNELATIPTAFTENFTYKRDATGRDFEVRYIGNIGEGSSDEPKTKNYLALLSGATIPEIPQLFSYVPADSMAIYIKNPKNLVDLLNAQSKDTNSFVGFDMTSSIKSLIANFLTIEDFAHIQDHLKDPVIIIINNIDTTAPEMALVFSTNDKQALSTSKMPIVEGKNAHSIISNSKSFIQKIKNLDINASLVKAPDFQYVWHKKSSLVRDAFVFVGDAFFAKVLTLENYIAHYRKYRDYRHLWALQEVVWAYKDAFGDDVNSFDQIKSINPAILDVTQLKDFTIKNNIVSHKNIGTIVSTKPISEAKYQLDTITRGELDMYRAGTNSYREIWQAVLDPMGIVFNRYQDGIEIDFLMTPIPALKDMDRIKGALKGATKKSLNYITNDKIRMGIVSLAIGVDLDQLQKNLSEVDDGFQSQIIALSKQFFNGNNVFDYFGGEVALSIGSVDDDIFSGWNVEKADLALLIQVASEEKGKEFIKLAKKALLDELGEGSSTSAISQFLAKPLIEDYNGKKIYYLENIPMYFVGKIGLAYTFIDDFFVIGLNRNTIKKYIDITQTGDARKKDIVQGDTFDNNTFVTMILDGKNTSKEIKEIYTKNKQLLHGHSGPVFKEIIQNRFIAQDRQRRLGNNITQQTYQYGGLSIFEIDGDIRVRLDNDKLQSLTGSLLEGLEEAKKGGSIPADIFEKNGFSARQFLLGNTSMINEVAFISHMDGVFDGRQSLLQNITFGLSLGDDEIGFRTRVYHEQDKKSSLGVVTNYTRLIVISIIFGILILGGVIVWIQKRKKSTQHSPTHSVAQDTSTIIIKSEDANQ